MSQGKIIRDDLPQMGYRKQTIQPKVRENSCLITVKVPYAVITKIWWNQKIVRRLYQEKVIDYADLKNEQERARIKKIERHRAHQESVTKRKRK